MKRKEKGFTIIELLASLAIIAMLVGLLVPTFNMIRNTARQAKQKAQFATIDQTLMAFKADYGDYPPSSARYMPTGKHYCGAQKLAEALLGWDLQGFHPDSDWTPDGLDKYGGPRTYNPPVPSDQSLNERVGPYLDVATANAFTLKQLFGDWTTTFGLPDRYVLCDSFGGKKVHIPPNKVFTAGNPILYYKANTSRRQMVAGDLSVNIYNGEDNLSVLTLKQKADGGIHPLADGSHVRFYNPEYKIIDPKATKAIDPLEASLAQWPYRADSYILISAGIDGLYGTSDDMLNFEN